MKHLLASHPLISGLIGVAALLTSCQESTIPTKRTTGPGTTLTTNKDTGNSADATGKTGNTGTAAQQASITDENTALQKNIDTVKASLGDLSAKLERERDREGKLSKELLGDAAAGCWAKQLVNNLEVTINGSHLDRGSQWESGDKPSGEGSPAQFRYMFGENFVHTNPDEEQNALLRPGGKIVSTDYANHRIADIEYIRVEKGGYGVESSKFCWTEWAFFTKCRWKNAEINRYRLDSLSIKINGEVLYNKESINYTFEGSQRVWEDRALAVNESFLRLMGRNDCPAAN